MCESDCGVWRLCFVCESENEMRVKRVLGFLTFCFSLINLPN